MKQTGVFAPVAVLAAASMAVGLFVAGRDNEASTASRVPSLGTLSSSGSHVDSTTITAAERATLDQAGIAAGVRELAERGGVRFYLGRSQNRGAVCYITGLVHGATPHFGVLTCPSDFPSEAQPILDYSPRMQTADALMPRILWLAGFAADGIACVGVRDSAGNVNWTPVIDNVYASNTMPATPAAAIVAEDTNGQMVYSRKLGSSMSYATG